MRKSGQPAGRQGFTLIEILVVATIIGVLSVAGVTSYTSINKRARDVKRKSDLEQVRSALEMYRTEMGYYPNPGSSSFVTLASLDPGDGSGPLIPKYLPAVPTDPKSTTGTTIPYYYSRIGSGPTYYSYCICAKVESDSGSNVCGITPISNCNYYLKNP
jgi:type II secretion system protein G